MFGINLSGMEFGLGLTVNYNYTVPDPSYFDTQNVQVMRLPFTLERLQPTAEQDLDPTYLGYITSIVAKNAAANVITVLDPHNFGYIATDGVSREIGVDRIGTDEYLDGIRRLAAAVRGMPYVALGLMNEPHDQSCSQLRPVWQQAIAEIRGVGFTGTITVPPTNWDSASAIVTNGCGAMIQSLVDPDNNLVAEVHSYLDPDGSGTYQQPIASTDIGPERLAPAIAWSRQSHIKLYLGETGAPSDSLSVSALQNELTTIKDAPDVFWGVTLWGAGPWWPTNYSMNLNPVNGSRKPQMVALSQFTTTPEALVLQLQGDIYDGDAKYTLTIDGQPIGGQHTEPAARNTGLVDLVTVPGPFTPGSHTVTVTFDNDLWGGSPVKDRNCYFEGAEFNNASLDAPPVALLVGGQQATFTFNAP